MGNFNRAEAVELYQKLKSTQPKDLKTKIAKKKPVKTEKGATQGEFVSVMCAMAHQVSEDQFISALEHRDMPAVKLSNREMELLRGGGVWEWCCDKARDLRDWYDYYTS